MKKHTLLRTLLVAAGMALASGTMHAQTHTGAAIKEGAKAGAEQVKGAAESTKAALTPAPKDAPAKVKAPRPPRQGQGTQPEREIPR